MNTIKHVTRMAPSPTGDFHIGSARTALFSWLAARSTGGRFVLRIDDTDLARNSDAAVAVIDDALDWLGLDHDLRVRQSDRLPLYADLADKLLSSGAAFRDGAAVRLKLPNGMPSGWTDTVTGVVPITDSDLKVIDGLVLVRSDGMPTYHFASVVDDMDLGITWVIRGMDHLANTAKHVAIMLALSRVDWPGAANAAMRWTHVGLVCKDRKKLSKRDGAASLLGYRDAGIDPDAMFNFLLRLGWGPTVDDRSVRTIDRARALALFLDGGSMRAAPSNMDLALLASLDRRYKGAKRAKTAA